jgi:hypothetical protein
MGHPGHRQFVAAGRRLRRPDLTIPGPGPMAPDVGRDRIYLTVSEYESNIWVANLER